ncbi:MAG: hypothetical protein IJU48_04230 [Synergistaceae bacterium]|nr:hypothetical protein [Synergistaceae bacterium]
MSGDGNIISQARKLTFRETANFLHDITLEDWPESLINSFSETERYFSSRTENFQIAICGLFQAGKSLTVNMMTGGSEISRISEVSGIRTSACNIYFYGSDYEHAQIFILSDEELAERLSSLLNLKINADSLWDKAAIDFIERKFISLWNAGNNYEFLEYPALLLSWMHNLPELRRYNNIRMELYEAMRLSPAPDDEDIRWSQFLSSHAEINNIDAFKMDLRRTFPINKIMYAFIKKISAGIKSDWMKRNNICIVDTPGLSVNSQDSRNAEEAIINADAVIYVFGGTRDKQLQNSEQDFILNLKRKIGSCPIVFAMNWPGKPKNTVLDTIQSLLELGGYGKEAIISYNALLSFRAEQGKRLLAGELDDTTAASLMRKAYEIGEKPSSPSEAWSFLVHDELYSFSKTDAKKILQEGLSERSIKTLDKFSGADKFIKAIFSSANIDDRKPLMTSQIITPLKTRLEELAEKLSDYKTSQLEIWNERQRKLESIVSKKTAEFYEIINNSWKLLISEEIFDRIKSNIPNIASLLAREFTEPDGIDFTKEWQKILDRAFDNWFSAFKNSSKSTTSKTPEHSVNFTDGWQAILEQALNNLFTAFKDTTCMSLKTLETFENRFTQLDSNDEILRRVWAEKVESHNSLLNIIIADITRHPIYIYADSNIYDKYIYQLIKVGSSEAISSQYFTAYINAKNSWNPFVDHEKKMREAQDNLKRDIQIRLYALFNEFSSSAITALAKSSSGEPMRIYDIAESWVNSIIKAVKLYIESMKDKELRKLNSIITRLSNYHHDKLADIKSYWKGENV